jgi:cysteine synthase A
MPASTVREKCELIEFYGGQCHLVEDPRTIYQVAADLADSTGGYYLDQFTYAERATDWRGNNNIAETMFAQLSREPFPVPVWVVVGGRHRLERVRRSDATCGCTKYPTLMCVVDPGGIGLLYRMEEPGFRGYCSWFQDRGDWTAAGRAELRTGAG